MTISDEKIEKLQRTLKEHDFGYNRKSDVCYLLNLFLQSGEVVLRSDVERNVSAWMLDNGFATGHGDDLDALLNDLKWQVEEMRKEVARLNAYIVDAPFQIVKQEAGEVLIKDYPEKVCHDCGTKAEGSYKATQTSTYHEAKCDVCGEVKGVTQPRDFGYPKFKKAGE